MSCLNKMFLKILQSQQTRGKKTTFNERNCQIVETEAEVTGKLELSKDVLKVIIFQMIKS